jgi:hypothetical protein
MRYRPNEEWPSGKARFSGHIYIHNSLSTDLLIANDDTFQVSLFYSQALSTLDGHPVAANNFPRVCLAFSGDLLASP